MMPKRARTLTIAVVVTFACYGDQHANAQATPDTENGRYTLSPLPDGNFLRLDSRSGVVARCVSASSGWECRVLPDERTALDAEIGRLQADNELLRSRLAQREANAGNSPGKSEEAFPKSDPLAPSMPRSADGERKLEIPLPSDRDLDRVMGMIERTWRRLVELAGRLQRDSSGKI